MLFMILWLYVLDHGTFLDLCWILPALSFDAEAKVNSDLEDRAALDLAGPQRIATHIANGPELVWFGAGQHLQQGPP